MFQSVKSDGMLKAIALIAGLAILLWSLGLPSLRFAFAAGLSQISDTLTDSAPSAVSDHDIQFTHPASGSGVANGNDIVITFPAGSFDLTGIGEEDIDLLIDGANKPVAEWSVVTGANTITITIDTGSIGAGSSTQILIGNNATNEGSPDTQITNPAAIGSYEIGIVADGDNGATRVVILDSIEVTASVDTIFTFAVSGVGDGITVNGDVTTGSTTSTTIPFGELSASTPTTSAQLLTVNTNAANGYVVTVQTDGNLESGGGGIIDNFVDGNDTNTPTTWAAPTGNINSDTTWGHWGITSDDATTTRATEFGSQEYVAASTSPRVVMSHTGPAAGSGTGVGVTYVGFRVEISALQEAGEDYSTNLTYIATPTF